MKSNKKPTYKELEDELAELKLHSPIQNEKEIGKTTFPEDGESTSLENLQNSKLLFDNMPSAFVYAKIIYENNKPVDFEFIEVNRAFTELTGLKNVVGKKESEVIPGIQNSDSEMFEIVGRVATTGIPEHVEYYVNALDKWFKVKIFSPKKGYYISVSDDITARKKIEEELIKAKERAERNERDLNKVQEITHTGTWYLDLSTDEVTFTKELYKMYGFDPTLPVPTYTEHQKLFTPESWESLSAEIAKTTETGIPYELELKTIRENGSYGWMWVRGETVIDVNNKTIGLWGAAQDVTDLKLAAEALYNVNKKVEESNQLKAAKERAEKNQERFRILMLNMEAGVVVHAPDTSIIQNNNRASEILGLSDDQMQGKTAIDPDWKFVKLDKSPLPFEEYPVNRIVNSKTSIKNQLVGIFQPGKENIVWLTINGFPVLSNTGAITEIVTVFIDITDQKQNEEDKLTDKLRLEKIEKELNEAQKIAHVGSWLFDLITQKIEWSDETFQIFGFDSKESAPEFATLIERIHPDDLELFNSAVEKAASIGLPYDIEHRICLPNDEQKMVRAICQPVLGVNGEVVSLVGTTQDITSQKQFEEAQIKYQRLKAIGEMSSSIAHDFNNSLQEMMGNLEVVKLQTDLSENTIERVNNIGSIIVDVAGRVKALQKFGDAEHDDQNAKLIDFNALIEESLIQSRPLWKDGMEKEGWRITVSTDFKEIPEISCNSGELKSAIYNLIKNSIEAMPEGGDIIIKTGIKAKGVFATFTDTGLGMDAETKLKVFQPFYSTKGFELGRGLGMSGVYSIVKKHKGDIAVKFSELGKGTTIEIIFPIGKQEEIKEISKNEIEPKDKKMFRVLWVDDDATIRENACEFLELIGHKCANANSGKSALKHLDENTYDIVFTDIGMPQMNGWELADAIRNKFGDTIKIVVVTGWHIDEEVKNENNIDFILQKPFTMKEVKKAFMVL